MKLEKEEIKKEYPFHTMAAILKRGQYFGEISLLKNSSHTSTLVAREDTLVVKIPKVEYISLLSEIEKKRLTDKIAFLKEIQLFEVW